MTDRESLNLAEGVGVVVLAMIFGGIVLAIYPGWKSIWDFLNNNLLLTKEAPAWIQAIGSILAIVAASVGTWWQINKNLKLQKIKDKESNILMADVCLEMCNAVLSVMRDTNPNPKKFRSMSEGMVASFMKKAPKKKQISLERVIDLQETMRLLLSKNLPIELMKSIFSLQKLLVQYKQYLQDINMAFDNDKLLSSVESGSSLLSLSKAVAELNDVVAVKVSVDNIIKNIVKYKNNL